MRVSPKVAIFASMFPALLLSSLLDSVEFYVIILVLAAAVIAFSVRGDSRGPVRQVLLPGVLSATDGEAPAPAIELVCADDGTVVLHRRGVRTVTEGGALSLAIKVRGFDVEIIERTAPARHPGGEPLDTASFILDFMGPEHYFISYRTDVEGLFAAVTLHNRPGIRLRKTLQ